jgi:RND superfamily putative drug exporter
MTSTSFIRKSSKTTATERQPATGFAARAGRWSAQHRRAAIVGWLAFVVLAVAASAAFPMKMLTASQSAVGESGAGARAADKAFPHSARETVLIQSRTLRANTPQFKAAVTDVEARLRATDGVRSVAGPRSAADAMHVSADGHSALVSFELRGDEMQTGMAVSAPRAAVAAAARAHPGMRIEETGDASLYEAVQKATDADLHKAELTSMPLTLGILMLAFGAFVAAGVPLLLAITGVVATMGLVGPISHLVPVDHTINSVVLLVGLAVGVDYSLFYVRRVREERAAGRETTAAIEAAAATSGHAVVISGMTVMIAMAGMYLTGAAVFTSLATGTVLVVAVSVLGSVSVLPAVLSKMGDRMNRGRLPFLGRLQRTAARRSMWAAVVESVLRRPLLAAAASVVVLLALAMPALSLKTSLPGTEGLPRSQAAVQTYDRVRVAFPEENGTATVVVQAADVTTPVVHAAIAELRRDAERQPSLFPGMTSVQTSPDRSTALVTIPMAGTGNDARSNQALDELRGHLVPATLGNADGVTASVDGATAMNRDFSQLLSSHLPLVFGFVLFAAFLLLLSTFRSIVIPLKAIVLNLLSVGAAYGILVMVFQKGWGEGLLGFESNGSIAAWLPLFLFVILFGLSMDYHVFILSRVREAYDGGMSTERAVAHAIKNTAGVVTSAALVMVGVFATFATLSDLPLKEMGVGLGAAVLIDATIIRGVLLPASMKLLGERNWWMPRSLAWVPSISAEGVAATGKPAAAPVGVGGC